MQSLNIPNESINIKPTAPPRDFVYCPNITPCTAVMSNKTATGTNRSCTTNILTTPFLSSLFEMIKSEAVYTTHRIEYKTISSWYGAPAIISPTNIRNPNAPTTTDETRVTVKRLFKIESLMLLVYYFTSHLLAATGHTLVNG
jgi:hypothetical protein